MCFIDFFAQIMSIFEKRTRSKLTTQHDNSHTIDPMAALNMAKVFHRNNDNNKAVVLSALAIDLYGSVGIEDLNGDYIWIRDNIPRPERLYRYIVDGTFFSRYPFYRDAVKRYVGLLSEDLLYERMEVVALRRKKYHTIDAIIESMSDIMAASIPNKEEWRYRYILGDYERDRECMMYF